MSTHASQIFKVGILLNNAYKLPGWVVPCVLTSIAQIKVIADIAVEASTHDQAVAPITLVPIGLK